MCVAVIKTEIWLCAPAQRWQSLPAGERGAQGEQVMKTGRLSSIRAPFLTKCSQHHNRILILLILLFLSLAHSLWLTITHNCIHLAEVKTSVSDKQPINSAAIYHLTPFKLSFCALVGSLFLAFFLFQSLTHANVILLQHLCVLTRFNCLRFHWFILHRHFCAVPLIISHQVELFHKTSDRNGNLALLGHGTRDFFSNERTYMPSSPVLNNLI